MIDADKANYLIKHEGFIDMCKQKPTDENDYILLWTGSEFHPCVNLKDGNILMGANRYNLDSFTVWKPFKIEIDEKGNIVI